MITTGGDVLLACDLTAQRVVLILRSADGAELKLHMSLAYAEGTHALLGAQIAALRACIPKEPA